MNLQELARAYRIGRAASRHKSFINLSKLSQLKIKQRVLLGGAEFAVAELHIGHTIALARLTNDVSQAWILEHRGCHMELQLETTTNYKIEKGLLSYGPEAENDRTKNLQPHGDQLQITRRLVYRGYSHNGEVGVVSKSGLTTLPDGLYIITNIRPDSLKYWA